MFALWTATLTIWQGHAQTHLLETANTLPSQHKVHRPHSALCDWKLEPMSKLHDSTDTSHVKGDSEEPSLALSTKTKDFPTSVL